MDVSLSKAELVALLLESIVYGIFVVLFLILLAIAFISTRGANMRSRRYIIPMAALMFTVATAHLIIDFLRVLQAFVPDNPRQTADKFFKQLSHPYSVLNWALYAFQAILGDCVLIWRCYILSGRKWWTVIPGTIMVLVNAAILGIISSDLTLTVGSKFIHLTTPWLVASLVNTTVLQVFYSGTVVAMVTRSFADTPRSVIPVVTAIIESCALYTVFSLGLLIAFLCASDADWVLIDVITSLVGVSFCLIIIQLQLHFRHGDRVTSWSVAQPSMRSRRGGPEDAAGPHNHVRLKAMREGVEGSSTSSVLAGTD